MTDDRIVQRLEEQLRDAHATNADLREQLADIKARQGEAHTMRLKGRDALAQLEKAHARERKAEDVARTARDKIVAAEHEALRARGELEELQKLFEIVKAEADALNELNSRVEKAKHVGDLFPAS